MYLSRKNNEYNDTVIINTTSTSIVIKEIGYFIVKVFAIRKDPVYLRVGYRSQIVAFNPIESVYNTIDIGYKFVTLPFSIKRWDHLTIKIIWMEIRFYYLIIVQNYL